MLPARTNAPWTSATAAPSSLAMARMRTPTSATQTFRSSAPRSAKDGLAGGIVATTGRLSEPLADRIMSRRLSTV